MIAFVWAEELNGYIGNHGDLPWHLPADMARFKRVTIGHTVVMGKTTFNSMHRPLPKRRNVVLSTSMPVQDGIEVVRSVAELQQLIDNTNDDIYIIGGAKVFESTQAIVNCLIRTVIEKSYKGDTKMPPIDYRNWRLVKSDHFEADEKNEAAYRFETWCKLDVE